MHPAQIRYPPDTSILSAGIFRKICVVIFNLISFSIITEASAGDPFQMFSHIIFQCILCVTLDAFFFGDRLCRITCHIFPVVDIHSGFINPYVSYQLIISGVDTVQDHFYIGGFQIDHTHLSGQVVGCLVTQQRLIHIVCQKCPVFAVAKSEQIGFGIQFDLIWKFGISHIPGTVSTTAGWKYRRHKAWCSCC